MASQGIVVKGMLAKCGGSVVGVQGGISVVE